MKSYYMKLASTPFSPLHLILGMCFPWKNFWKSLAPFRVTFFIREVARDSILYDNLQKGGNLGELVPVMQRCSRIGEPLIASLPFCKSSLGSSL